MEATQEDRDVRTLTTPETLEKMIGRMDKMGPGSWGVNDQTFCMMSAVVDGARSSLDCAVAGWPRWLAQLAPRLYDSRTHPDAAQNRHEANQWALEFMKEAQHPADYAELHDRINHRLASLIGAQTNQPQQRASFPRRTGMMIAKLAMETQALGNTEKARETRDILRVRDYIHKHRDPGQAARELIESRTNQNVITAVLCNIALAERRGEELRRTTRMLRWTILQEMRNCRDAQQETIKSEARESRRRPLRQTDTAELRTAAANSA